MKKESPPPPMNQYRFHRGRGLGSNFDMNAKLTTADVDKMKVILQCSFKQEIYMYATLMSFAN